MKVLSPDLFDKKQVEMDGIRFKLAKRRILQKTYYPNGVVAFDTETYRGSCRLICLSECNMKGEVITSKYIMNPTFEEALRFLCHGIKKANLYRFAFNLDFDVQAVLKLHDDLEFHDQISKGYKVVYGKWELRWVRGKFFQIKDIKAKRSLMWTDLIPFYNLGLGKSAKTYLKEDIGKLEMDGERLNSDLKYWENNEAKIIEYCQVDAILTAKLGVLLINTILEEKLFLPRTLVSPASITKANIKRLEFSDLRYIPSTVIKIARKTYYGGRFEVFEKGCFKNTYLYDINSAYPNAVRRLPDMKDGVWVHEKTEWGDDVKIPKNPPTFGFYKVSVRIPAKIRICYLPVKRRDGIVTYPVGNFTGWYAWHDLDLARKFVIKVHESIEYRACCKSYRERKNKPRYEYPFMGFIKRLYERKKKLNKKTDPMNYNVIKITLNALYGCFLELKTYHELTDDGTERVVKEAGKLYNPVYGSWIASKCRRALFKDLPLAIRNKILAVHTDSLISKVKLDSYLKIGDNLGWWSLETSGKTIILGTGQYQIGDLVKSRGIPRGHVGDWFEFCRKHDDDVEVKIELKRMKKIRSCIIQDKDILLLNTMVPLIRTLNVNKDVKRTFLERMKFGDLLDKSFKSRPVHYSDECGFMPNLLKIMPLDGQYDKINALINQALMERDREKILAIKK